MNKLREKLDKIAWETIDKLPQYPVAEAGLSLSGRPRTYAEMGVQIQRGIVWDLVESMFLHEFYQHRDASFFAAEPPEFFTDLQRVMLAGTAEFLCHRFGYEVPAWTEKPEYFLAEERSCFEDFLAPSVLAGLKATHVRRSSPEFLRRNLILPTRSLIHL
jgi:hypothetical protein